MGSEKNAAFYDEIYASVELYRLHYAQSRCYPLWMQVLKFMEICPSSKILEIGCGTGQFAHLLYDEGYKAYRGFDFSAEAIRIASSMVNQSFFIADALDETAYGKDYNIAVAIDMLEHVEDDIRILKNITRGTFFVFTLPTFDDQAHVRWFENQEEIIKRYQRHINFIGIAFVKPWFACVGTVV